MFAFYALPFVPAMVAAFLDRYVFSYMDDFEATENMKQGWLVVSVGLAPVLPIQLLYLATGQSEFFSGVTKWTLSFWVPFITLMFGLFFGALGAGLG